MAVFAYPTVEGNLGKLTKNIKVLQADTNLAGVNEQALTEAGVQIGDVIFLTLSDGSSDLYKVAAAYALKLYSHAA